MWKAGAMTQVWPPPAASLIGADAAVQTSMLGSVGGARGPAEAGWQSILATVMGVAVILAIRAWRGDQPA